MKIIFLDMDGVVNRRPTKEELAGLKSLWSKEFENEIVGLNPKLVKNLKTVLDSTGAFLVSSSSWRYFEDHPTVGDNWRKTLSEMLEKDTSIFIGNTPELSLVKNRRGSEIKKWIDDNQNIEIEKYCVIDDNTEDIIKVIPRNNVFKTDENVGLSEDIADKIIEFLND